MRICCDEQEATRYFTIAEAAQTEENEFNLNLPRYVDTFEPEERVPLLTAVEALRDARQAAKLSEARLDRLLEALR